MYLGEGKRLDRRKTAPFGPIRKCNGPSALSRQLVSSEYVSPNASSFVLLQRKESSLTNASFIGMRPWMHELEQILSFSKFIKS